MLFGIRGVDTATPTKPFTVSNFVLDVGRVFGSVLDSILMIYHVCCITFSCIDSAFIFIDLGMDFGIFVDICLIPFPFAHTTCKTLEIIIVAMNLHVCTYQKI